MPGITNDVEIGINDYEPVEQISNKKKLMGLINSFFQPIQFVSYDPDLRKEDNNC